MMSALAVQCAGQCWPKTVFKGIRVALHHLYLVQKWTGIVAAAAAMTQPQPVKICLNKKSLPKQNTIQNFTIDAQEFRKTRNENPPTQDIGVTS